MYDHVVCWPIHVWTKQPNPQTKWGSHNVLFNLFCFSSSIGAIHYFSLEIKTFAHSKLTFNLVGMWTEYWGTESVQTSHTKHEKHYVFKMKWEFVRVFYRYLHIFNISGLRFQSVYDLRKRAPWLDTCYRGKHFVQVYRPSRSWQQVCQSL